MSLNLLVTAPISYVIGTLSDEPTQAEKAVHDGIAFLSAEWVLAGTDGASNLFIVITRAAEVQPIQDMIAATGVPLTIVHAQNAHESIVVDEEGMPILDAEDQQQTHVRVYVQAGDLLPYMADIVAEDGSTTPATEVILPIYGGHAGWEALA